MDRDQAIRVLGLPASGYSEADLVRAYRDKVRAHHPDLHGAGAESEMREINLARQVLAEQAKRNFGVAGKEVWADIRGWRMDPEPSADIVAKPARPESGRIGRFVRKFHPGRE